MISKDCVQFLGLKPRRFDGDVFGLGNQKVAETKEIVRVTVHSRTDSTFETHLEAHFLPKVTSLQPTIMLNNELHHLKQLNFADPEFDVPAHIDILIGADLFFDMLRPGTIPGPDGCPRGYLHSLRLDCVGNNVSSLSTKSSQFSSHLLRSKKYRDAVL